MLSLTKYDNNFLQKEKKMFKKLIKNSYIKKWLHQSDIYKELRQDNILIFFLIFF